MKSVPMFLTLLGAIFFTGTVCAGEELFPDGRALAPTWRIAASIITPDGHLNQNDEAWAKVATFVEKGGPAGVNAITVSVKLEDFAEGKGSCFNTGLITVLREKPMKAVVSFSAKSDDADDPEVVVSRRYGGSGSARVALAPEWTKYEIAVEANAEHPIDALIFAPFPGNRRRTGSFRIANISVKATE